MLVDTIQSQLATYLERLQQPCEVFAALYDPANSPKIHQVYTMCEQVARSDSTSVLIQGESGSGKEVVARAIH